MRSPMCRRYRRSTGTPTQRHLTRRAAKSVTTSWMVPFLGGDRQQAAPGLNGDPRAVDGWRCDGRQAAVGWRNGEMEMLVAQPCCTQERVRAPLGDFVHREVFSRTRSSLDVAMSDDVGRLAAVAHPQYADQAAD